MGGGIVVRINNELLLQRPHSVKVPAYQMKETVSDSKVECVKLRVAGEYLLVRARRQRGWCCRQGCE